VRVGRGRQYDVRMEMRGAETRCECYWVLVMVLEGEDGG
jgi:hypothetical protein